MRYPWNLKILLAALLALGLTCSCAQAPPKPTLPTGNYYVTQEIIYMRETPDPQGNILGQLAQGDEVAVLDSSDPAWWRVGDLRSGQAGWVQKELLSPEPVPGAYYVVNADQIMLRNCPRQDCPGLQMLFRGDKVKKVEESPQGWWRILLPQSRSLGWVPAAALAKELEATPAQVPGSYYYVAVKKLSLRAKPSAQSDIVRILQFNDQVQKLEQNTLGWFKVRQPSSGAVGWLRGNFLGPLPGVIPRGQALPGTKLRPVKPGEEPALEPELL